MAKNTAVGCAEQSHHNTNFRIIRNWLNQTDGLHGLCCRLFTVNELERKQIYWHSRRGMLELDLLLLPFVDQHFDSLSPALQEQYQELLRCEDQDIFAWLLLRDRPPQTGLKEIVGLILENAGKRN